MARSLRLVDDSPRFLPMTKDECIERGWLPTDDARFDARKHGVDFVFVSGDAYVDHPSFANAVIPRLLEREGYRVVVLAQPKWDNADAFKVFGRPRVAWLVSAGNLDSMLNNYTAHKRPRSDDQYAPRGEGGVRPDYATVVYAQRCREAAKGVPVIIGGVEASMRRTAHYDYWSDKVRRSIVLDARADLLVYGMGETPLLEIVRRLKAGEAVADIRDVAGTAYYVGKKTIPHFMISLSDASASSPTVARTNDAGANETEAHVDGADVDGASDNDAWWNRLPDAVTLLPSFDDVRGDDPESKRLFASAQHTFHREQNPESAPILVQRHGELAVIVNPPQRPMTTESLDAVFALPYLRVPHPLYGDDVIPAYDMVKFSVNVMRGCFGGCTFCAITEHQGKKIQSRSEASVLAEVEAMTKLPGFTGVLSDLGGPTANMYRMTCSEPEVEKTCRRPSCVHPTVCKMLTTDHTPIKSLMKKVREAPGVKKVLIASGVRMDLAIKDQQYIDELAAHHVGGHLKVAPEHVDADTLYLMKKPGVDVYLDFEKRFQDASMRAGKEQYLVPYFVSSHPGCELDGAVDLAEFLKSRNQRVRQVQDFIPTPGTPATCMWWSGIEPVSMKPVFVEHKMRNKRKQKALMQYWIPENAPLVREALREAGRNDLIGYGASALVGAWDKPETGLPRMAKSQGGSTSSSASTTKRPTVSGGDGPSKSGTPRRHRHRRRPS